MNITDAGTMISGMILNLLSDAKIRLYRWSHFFEDKTIGGEDLFHILLKVPAKNSFCEE